MHSFHAAKLNLAHMFSYERLALEQGIFVLLLVSREPRYISRVVTARRSSMKKFGYPILSQDDADQKLGNSSLRSLCLSRKNIMQKSTRFTRHVSSGSLFRGEVTAFEALLD